MCKRNNKETLNMIISCLCELFKAANEFSFLKLASAEYVTMSGKLRFLKTSITSERKK